jgi:hypothetical protein
VAREHRAETTLLYFVGPAGVDLSQAVTARSSSPEPPPSELPEVGAFEWLLVSSPDTDDYGCSLVVSTLRPGFESVAIELDDTAGPGRRASHLCQGRRRLRRSAMRKCQKLFGHTVIASSSR